MRFLLPSQRQARVSAFFRKHGSKTVFFARFFALVRVGVYAYAGSQRMRWSRFLFLDLLEPITRPDFNLFDRPDEPGELLFVLKPTS